MTYRELPYQSEDEYAYTEDIGIEYAQQLFKCNNKPYLLKDSIYGPKTKAIFTEHFIYTMRDADSNGCLAKMSIKEKHLYWDYLNYQGIVNSIMITNPTYNDAEVDAAAKIEYELNSVYNTPELVVRTLSDWAYAEVLNFEKDSCYSTMHTWE
mgnify:CR=1 FL=1